MGLNIDATQAKAAINQIVEAVKTIETEGGNVKDVFNNMDLSKSFQNLPIDKIEQLKTEMQGAFEKFEETIKFIREEKLSDAIQVFFDIHDYGYSVIDILDYFFNFIKQNITTLT